MINRFYARFYFDIGTCTVSEKMISRRNITKKFCFEHKQTLKLRSTKPSLVYNKSYTRVVRSWRTAHNRRLSSVSRSATLLEARAEELFLARNAVRSVHLCVRNGKQRAMRCLLSNAFVSTEKLFCSACLLGGNTGT